MLEEIFFILIIVVIIIGYILIGYYVTKYVRKLTVSYKGIPRLILLSFLYTMIYGIGLIGGGGNPGFALPSPLVFIGIFDMLECVEWKIFINGFIIPLTFWWILIFMIMLIKYWIKEKE